MSEFARSLDLQRAGVKGGGRISADRLTATGIHKVVGQAGGPRTTLEGLAGVAEAVDFEPSAQIIREGDDSDSLYVLTEGRVEVSGHGEGGGPERVIRTMSAPAYFGEIGVLERVPRTASVTALSACRCERIEGQAFLDALLSAPPSSSLMENSRSRLGVTHPSRRVTFDLPESV
jgi:CRP-like cAMP-binding protein